ncbi:Glyoxalase/Bleomycin resistance protein/Dioxygenase superfamily-domain-containing protein [Tribonema minus]|uniref:Glyoxalase/Bleomycin resistance protein/Dioxygenase superfamily-domain-containing protein n=1 Tax=Tribonema minus TaxID=303371 RepID=A0A835ZFN3_9STRA|nr:Glyoxalase/Bleomycin resistance protein/Dioxygenase superfamily-domain-containing protein [Tribonema minus]
MALRAAASSLLRTSSAVGTATLARPMTIAVRHMATDKEQRPFRVLGMQQVAIGALKKKALLDLWCGVLGVPQTGSYTSKGENVNEDILRLGEGPFAVEIDLMEPLDPNVPPKVHVPSLNHIGIWVDPLDKAVEYLTAKGVRFTPGGIRKGAAGYNVTFIHPKGNADKPLSGEGVLIELVQPPPEVIAAFDAKK